MANNVNLFATFVSFDGFREVFEKLLNQADPTVTLLALDGLFRVESVVEREQFFYYGAKIRELLRRWRNDNDSGKYVWITKKVLRELTIFKTYKVPLFIDDYGEKNLLRSYKKNGEREY